MTSERVVRSQAKKAKSIMVHEAVEVNNQFHKVKREIDYTTFDNWLKQMKVVGVRLVFSERQMNIGKSKSTVKVLSVNTNNLNGPIYYILTNKIAVNKYREYEYYKDRNAKTITKVQEKTTIHRNSVVTTHKDPELVDHDEELIDDISGLVHKPLNS